MIEKILNNGAIVGFLGVIIGAILSILGALIQSILNNKHARTLHSLQNREEKEKLLRESKKGAYVDFLNLLEQKRMLIYAKNQDLDIHNEARTQLSKKVNHIMSIFSLLAPFELVTKSVDLFDRCDDYMVDGSYDLQFKKIISLMKKDLGIGE